MTSRRGGALGVDRAAWSSPWRHISVADKAVLCVSLLVTALIVPSVPCALVVVAATTTIAVGLAKTSWGTWGVTLAAPTAFLLPTGVALALVVHWSPFAVSVTPESVDDAVHTTLRAFAATSAMLLLAVTTPMTDLLAGLRRLGVPQAIVDVAGVSYRMVFTLIDTARSLRAAQVARLGLRTRRSELSGAAASASTVLVRSWEHATRLDAGLVGRGGGGSLRVMTRAQTRSPALYGLAVGCVAVTVASAWLWNRGGLPW